MFLCAHVGEDGARDGDVSPEVDVEQCSCLLGTIITNQRLGFILQTCLGIVNVDYLTSSSAPIIFTPALLKRMSILRKGSMATLTASWIFSSGHDRSRAMTSAPLSARSLTSSGLRAVAMTLSPRARAASAVSWPKPVEQPVMNQIAMLLRMIVCIKE